MGHSTQDPRLDLKKHILPYIYICTFSLLWVSPIFSPKTWTGNFNGSLFVLRMMMLFFYKKLKNVSCEYDRLNGWNSTLQAVWYIGHVRWASLFYNRYFIYNMFFVKWTCLMVVSTFTKILRKIVRACSIFYAHMKDIGRWLPWMLPGSTGRFSMAILCTDTI